MGKLCLQAVDLLLIGFLLRAELGFLCSQTVIFRAKADYIYCTEAYYDEDRQSKPVVALGDEVALRYSAYIFKNSRPSTDNLFATNDEAKIKELVSAGLDASYEWSSEPLVVTFGEGEILDSLEIALEGCHEGDSVEVYLTFEAGYGNKYLGMVPPKSATAWFIDILSVTKK